MNKILNILNITNETQDNNKEEELICKLCHDSIIIKDNDHYSPCLCKGSVGLIHKDCFNTLIENEERCGVCLTDYPNISQGTPDIKMIMDVLVSKLDKILYEMDGKTQIQQIYKLFTTDTSFFESMIESMLQIENVRTYGIKELKTEEYLQGIASLPPIIEDSEADSSNDEDEEDEEDNDELFNVDIAEDILNSLNQINTLVYQSYEMQHHTQENRYEYDFNEDITLSEFRKALNLYYIDITYHSLNYLSYNPMSCIKILGMSFIFNTALVYKKLISLFLPHRINNIYGLLLIESNPLITMSRKHKLNKYIVDDVMYGNGSIDSASLIESSFKKLDNWKLNILGLSIVFINYMTLYGILYGTYYIGSSMISLVY